LVVKKQGALKTLLLKSTSESRIRESSAIQVAAARRTLRQKVGGNGG
jgi:hypothetical protein